MDPLLGFFHPPLPWGFRLWTFDRKWATCTRSTMCSWPSKKKTARHFTSGGPGETTKVTRVLCVFSWGGNEWTIYTVVIQTEKTGGPHFVVHLLEVHKRKTHVDLINEYQSPKRQNMFQHGSTSCEPKQSLFQGLFWCAYLVIVVVVKPIVPKHRYHLGERIQSSGPPIWWSLLSCWQLTILFG